MTGARSDVARHGSIAVALAVGSWQLVVGGWWLVVGGWSDIGFRASGDWRREGVVGLPVRLQRVAFRLGCPLRPYAVALFWKPAA